MTNALYPAEKYTYRVLWSEDARRYVGVCSEFPTLSFQAATHAVALDGIIAWVREMLENIRRLGQVAPTPAAIKLIGGRE